MSKTKKIILITFGTIVVLLILCYVDYWVAYKNGNRPIMSIKKEYNNQQLETYKGLFYTMWKCTAEEENYGFGKVPSCPLKIEYDGDYFTNANGIKISKEDTSMLILSFGGNINTFKTKSEIDNALLVSKEFWGSSWEYKDSTLIEKDGYKAGVAAFKKFVKDEKGEYSWVAQKEDPEYLKCVTRSSDGKQLLFSEYKKGTCVGEWNKHKFSEEYCDLVLNKNIHDGIKEITILNKMCE